VLDQCITGLWNRFREHANASGTAKNTGRRPELWTRAFGDIVESWCHRVARSADIQERVILTAVGATEQVEDVVLQSDQGVVLFSVKARLLPESLVKGSSSRRECVDALDTFLFADSTKGKQNGRSRRPGVLRQLDATIARARGAMGVDAKTPIVPVLVTYDQYGLDNEPCYRWVQRRCRELGLFALSAPVTFMTVNDFEWLFAYAEQGNSVVTFLLERSRMEGGRYPVHVALADRCPRGFTKAADREFDSLGAEIMEHVREISTRPI
jgi:hypothetical protein